MHSNKWLSAMTFPIVLGLVLSACAPATTPAPAATQAAAATDAPQATQVAEATKAPEATQAPAPTEAPAVEQIMVGAFDVGPMGSWDAVPYYTSAGWEWLLKVYSPLTSLNRTFDGLEPQLAVAWEPNADYTEWTIHLRDGVKWHDGEPFTADDVKFTFELVSNPAAGTTYSAISNVKSIKGAAEMLAGTATDLPGVVVVDPLTIKFELTAPDPRLPFNLWNLYILPKHLLADVQPADLKGMEWWRTSPVGTGPFKFSAYEKDQFIELVANADYWKGRPVLDKLVNRYFADEAAAIIALEAGDIQFTYVSSDVTGRFTDAAQWVTFEAPSYVTNMFMFNFRKPIFQDVRVRQAFLYAIDRQAIVTDIAKGTAQVAPCYDPFPIYWPADAEPYAYNPDKAKSLLAEAGWDSSQKIELYTYYSSQFHKDTLAAVQAYLSEVGINVEYVTMEPAAWREITEAQDPQYDIAYRGAGNQIAFMETSFLYSNGRPDWTTGSYYGWNLPELDTLLKAMETAAPDDYGQARTDLCSYMNREALLGYMWVANRYGVASTAVENFYYYPAAATYEDSSETWKVVK